MLLCPMLGLSGALLSAAYLLWLLALLLPVQPWLVLLLHLPSRCSLAALDAGAPMLHTNPPSASVIFFLPLVLILDRKSVD